MNNTDRLIYEAYATKQLREWSPTNDPANNPGLAAGTSLISAQDNGDLSSVEKLVMALDSGHGVIAHLAQAAGRNPSIQGSGEIEVSINSSDDYDTLGGDYIFYGYTENGEEVRFTGADITSWQRSE